MRLQIESKMKPLQTNLGQLSISAFALMAMLIATGCQPFQKSAAPEMPVGGNSSAMYQVQMIPKFGKPTVTKHVIRDKMTVQDVIEETGAVTQFRSMEITLSRLVNEPRKSVLKLPIEYRYEKQAVVDYQNYSIHPGDTLVIKARSAGSLDKLVGALSGDML